MGLKVLGFPGAERNEMRPALGDIKFVDHHEAGSEPGGFSLANCSASARGARIARRPTGRFG